MYFRLMMNRGIFLNRRGPEEGENLWVDFSWFVRPLADDSARSRKTEFHRVVVKRLLSPTG